MRQHRFQTFFEPPWEQRRRQSRTQLIKFSTRHSRRQNQNIQILFNIAQNVQGSELNLEADTCACVQLFHGILYLSTITHHCDIRQINSSLYAIDENHEMLSLFSTFTKAVVNVMFCPFPSWPIRESITPLHLWCRECFLSKPNTGTL